MGKLERWLTVAGLGLGLLVSGGLGVAAASYGGIPHDHDRFGVVAVPGRQVLELPSGRVMIDRVDDVYECWDNTNHVKNAGLNRAPDGMVIRVVSVRDDLKPLPITAVSPSLYLSERGCRGHTPFGRIDVPHAGQYLVESADSESGSFTGAPDLSGAMTTTSTEGPGFAFGPAPWALLGSPLLAGLTIAILVLAGEAFLAAAGILIWSDGSFQSRWRQIVHPLRHVSRILRG